MRTAKRHGTLGNLLLSIFVLAFVSAPALVFAAEGIAGDWEMTMDFNGRTTFATLSIAKKADGAFTGTWGRNELSDVKFDGEKLTFTRTIKMGEREFTMTYAGTLKEGKLTGTLSSDRGSFAANGARKVPMCPVVGQWDLAFTIRDQARTARLSVVRKPDGTPDVAWKSQTGEHTISNVKIEDGKLSFARKSKMNDREFESTFEGTVKGNAISGTMKSQMGEIAVTGQRFGANLIGAWELATTSDQGPRTGMLTVFGDLTGRYELFGGEIPIKEIKLEGDQVAFSVEMGFGDQAFKLDFKGKLDGKTLKGEVTSPRGTREVTGKKMEPAAAIVGTWEFTRETPQGTRTNKLTIKEDMTGTYTGRETTVPITDLAVDGDQVSFKATMKYNETEVPLSFKGKVSGGTLTGEFTTPRGTREATGKKVGPTQ
jgi:hypothetical protein